MRKTSWVALFILGVLAAPPAMAQNASVEQREVTAFHRTIADRPFWFADGADQALLDLMESAASRDINAPGVDLAQLRRSLEKARSGSRSDRSKAELQLSQAFVRFAASLAAPRDRDILYTDEAARGRRPTPLTLLTEAGRAPSLAQHVRKTGWMHPVFRDLRQAALVAERDGNVEEARRLRLNLERARTLPAGDGPHVVVNIPAARLDFYDGGKVVRSMRVVVGKAGTQTPLMAGVIRYAVLNPYWHVPPELTRDRIAPRVLKEGRGYLRSKGYQVVSAFSRSPAIVDPATVDWKAVASGRKQAFLRQLPGPQNGMGEIKFMFPNELGIYLHDTPGKTLFEQDDRTASAGCVRLEDAQGLARLIFGDAPVDNPTKPEQIVPLLRPVPVHLTYLTAEPQRGQIVRRPDVYGKDEAALAAAGRSNNARSAP